MGSRLITANQLITKPICAIEHPWFERHVTNWWALRMSSSPLWGGPRPLPRSVDDRTTHRDVPGPSPPADDGFRRHQPVDLRDRHRPRRPCRPRRRRAHDAALGAAMLHCFGTVTAITIWYWHEMHRLAITREVKRVELQILQIGQTLAEREGSPGRVPYNRPRPPDGYQQRSDR